MVRQKHHVVARAGRQPGQRQIAERFFSGCTAVTDFDNEMAQAQMNLTISGVHTLFLPSGSASSFIQSKFVRDVARFGGDLSSLVPLPVEHMLKQKYQS